MTSVKDTPSPLAVSPGLVFHGISFDPANRTVRIFDLAGFDAELKDPTVFSWIDIEAPDITPLNEVLRRYGHRSRARLALRPPRGAAAHRGAAGLPGLQSLPDLRSRTGTSTRRKPSRRSSSPG
jgi:hypothetical protein